MFRPAQTRFRSNRWPAKAVMFVITTCCFQSLEAAKRSHHHPVAHPLSEDVQPTTEIEQRVAYEVARAKQILNDPNTNNLLANPWLVSAIYYHDGFLTDFPSERTSAAPERRIIGQISNVLSPEQKARFVRLLHEIWIQSNPVGPAQFIDPVDSSALAGGRGSHKYAIDMFAAEGTAVHSASRGIAVLADRDWSPDNVFSTSSRKGGNSVIIFDPDDNRFYRYCHLNAVLVTPGQLVAGGQSIGTVGHTGLNASQPGHGGHLHFEVNEYQNGHVRAISYRELLGMLREWKSSQYLSAP